MSSAADHFMRAALALARSSAPFPNPPVGALVVRQGRVVGVGHHERAGTPHAEVIALRAAGELARGADLYVTLEPCNHVGRTPPCVDAVLAAGIARVMIGCLDPNPFVRGGGCARLAAAGVTVGFGAWRAEAEATIAEWFRTLREPKSLELRRSLTLLFRWTELANGISSIILETMVKPLSPKQASERIAHGEVEVIDVREPHEWLDGHVPTARLVPLAQFRQSPKAVLGSRAVLFVCAAGVRSETAARLAAQSGFKDVYNLTGGTRAWVNAGLALDHEAAVTAAE